MHKAEVKHCLENAIQAAETLRHLMDVAESNNDFLTIEYLRNFAMALSARTDCASARIEANPNITCEDCAPWWIWANIEYPEIEPFEYMAKSILRELANSPSAR